MTNWFYDVAHKIALRDGGTNTLDNIEPLHPAEHRARHREQGDFSRWKKEDWARWRAAAAAKGATIKRGLGLIDPSVLTGIASGRIRLDSPDNFVSDFFGVPSIEDERREFEHHQRQIDPTWKPGDGWGI